MPGPMRDPGPSAHDAMARLLTTPSDGGDQPDYTQWSVPQLRRRAAELAVPGRARMRRAELIEALRTR